MAVQRTAVSGNILRQRPNVALGAVEPDQPPTAEEVATRLLALRQSLSALWPQVRQRAPQLTDNERRAWNRAVWLLIDMELRLIARLSQEGAVGSDGRPLAQSFDANDLYRRLQVGVFAGVGGDGSLGEPVTLSLALWAAIALGISGLSAAVFATLYITSISREELAVAEQTATLFRDAVNAGVDPAEALRQVTAIEAERLRNLREKRKTRIPGWAKGLMVTAGAAVVGVGIAAVVSGGARRRLKQAVA